MSLSAFFTAIATKSSDFSESDKRNRYNALISARATLTYTLIATNTSQDQTLTVAGAAVGDLILVGAPVLVAGLTVTTFVSAANTVTVRLHNATGGGITPGALVFNVALFKP